MTDQIDERISDIEKSIKRLEETYQRLQKAIEYLNLAAELSSKTLCRLSQAINADILEE